MIFKIFKLQKYIYILYFLKHIISKQEIDPVKAQRKDIVVYVLCVWFGDDH